MAKVLLLAESILEEEEEEEGGGRPSRSSLAGMTDRSANCDAQLIALIKLDQQIAPNNVNN